MEYGYFVFAYDMEVVFSIHKKRIFGLDTF